MLHCPTRSPRSRSSRLPGGTVSSRTSRIRFSWSSFRRATGQRLLGQHRSAATETVPSKTSSVPWSLNDRITLCIIRSPASSGKGGHDGPVAWRLRSPKRGTRRRQRKVSAGHSRASGGHDQPPKEGRGKVREPLPGRPSTLVRRHSVGPDRCGLNCEACDCLLASARVHFVRRVPGALSCSFGGRFVSRFAR